MLNKEAFMSWTDTILKTALTGVALLAAVPALANSIVVRSNGPSAGAYPPGKSLPANTQIALRAGDAVVVMDSGGTRVLKGPGKLAVSGSSAASGSGFASLISNTGARQSRTGATRSSIGGGPARSPNVWYVDATKSGSMCVIDSATMSLWRPSDAELGTMKVTRLSDNKTVSLEFRAGQSTRAWPALDLPVTEGSQYRIEGAGLKAPATIKTTMLGAFPTGLEGTAEMLLGKGCSNQVNLLVEASIQQPGG
jgi:hypothetical protein